MDDRGSILSNRSGACRLAEPTRCDLSPFAVGRRHTGRVSDVPPKLDDDPVDGVFETDGFIDAREFTPEQLLGK
jgi:hypothetical protein